MPAARTIGSGAHVVLAVSGIFGSATAWQPLWPYLDESLFTYHFLDYRGYGARATVAGDYSMEEAGADVLAFADEIGADRFSVLGHSMGGSVMQQVLVQAPDRVRSLFGIAPVPASGAPFDEQTWQLFQAAATDIAARRAIIDFSSGAGRLSSVWVDALARRSADTSTPAAFTGYLNAFATTDFHHEIEGNTTPVRTLVGRHDPANNEAAMLETFARWYPNHTSIVLADAGHYAVDEAPILVATELERAIAALER